MSELVITKSTKVYIQAPANVATGGPELLHQLAFHLINEFGINACMNYTGQKNEDPVHPNYLKYNIPNVRNIDDLSDNVIIVPELFTNIEALVKYKNIQKIVWWLSLDFFFLTMFSKNHPFQTLMHRVIGIINKKLGRKALPELVDKAIKHYKNISLTEFSNVNTVSLHMVQSQYALEYLNNNGINDATYLSDYLRDDFLSIDVQIKTKKNIVIYNPKKGIDFTKKIISKGKNIEFIAIQNMTPVEVIELMKIAKVYIDFGNHPGKDRIPREAAILGCCVITGKRGSAFNALDVEINEEFKFEDVEESVDSIIEKIRCVFENFETEQKKFIRYIEKIKNEKSTFIKDSGRIFTR
jgi:hypothetical protein